MRYNVTDKYTELDFINDGISKDGSFNCLSMCLDFCKNELEMPYDFDENIVDDINWENIIDLFKDNPQKIFKQLEQYFLNYYDIIAPHEMRKGDVLVIEQGDVKTPCIYVGGNKILLVIKDNIKVNFEKNDKNPITFTDGVKVINLNSIKVFNVYRVKKKPKKITTKAVYKMGDSSEDLELIEEECYLYDGDVAECALPAVVGYIIRIIIMIIISYIISLLTAPDIPDGEIDQGRLINTRSTQEPIRVIYGLQRVGGNDVFIESAGQFHKELYIVQTLSDGKCEGIDQVDSVDQILIDGHPPSYYGGKISYTFHNGSSTQTYDTTINAVRPDYTDNMRHTCYIAWHITHDKNLFPYGKPSRTVDLKGRKVLDFRDDTTAWSQNGILILYDFFTSKEYGLGVPTDKIDITSWTVAANYFDNKGWKFNYSAGGSKAYLIAKDMMKHFRCSESWFDGKYFLLVADINEESSVMVIKDEHIIQNNGKSTAKLLESGRFETPSAIRVKFIDKDKDYTKDDIYIGEEDGVVKDMSLMGYTDRKTVGDIATYYLERARLNRTVTLTGRDDLLQVAPYDLVTFNSTALSIADQPMRVVSTSYNGGLINLTLQFETESLYNDTYEVEIEGNYNCSLPDGNVVITIQNPQVSEEIFYYGLRTESRLHITFTVSEEASFFKHVEVWTSITSISGTVPEDSDYEHQFNTTNDFPLEHVQHGQVYYIVLVPVSINGIKETFSNAPKLSITIIGNSSAPQSLSYLSAIPSNNSLTLFSDKLDDPDIEIYEFRIGTQWQGGVFLYALRSPNAQLPGVKPGVHTFLCNTKGTNDMYGNNPQSATATVFQPVGWSLYTSFTDDYTGVSGTFNNTEHTTYASEDYLMCTHSGSLSGSYNSETFDIGITAVEYYIYLEADIVVTGAGTTWDDITISGTLTWDEIGVQTKTWNEIFTVDEAPKVNITILYKENSGDSWSESNNAEILSSIITARYLQVKIEIEDPSYALYAKVEHFTLKLYTKT